MILLTPDVLPTPASTCRPARAGWPAFVIALVSSALPGSVLAADDCTVLYNASIKTLQTPHHVFSTKTPASGVKATPGN